MKPLHTHQTGAITYTRSIIDSRTGKTVKVFAPRRNLIVDQGLNTLASQSWSTCFRYLALGTGTNAFKRDSGLTTFSRSGTTITASTGWFQVGDTGSLLKWDTGEECYITYVNATTATSSVSGTIASAEGTLYHVNRTGLQTEVKRSSTLTTDPGDTGSSYNAATGVVTLWRSLLGSVEVGTVNYKEVAWSPTSTAGNNIFGGDLLPGGGDTLSAGQQYKVKIQLDLTLSPILASVPFAALTPPAWPAVAGNARLENIGVSGSDIPVLWPNNQANEPANTGALHISTATTALRTASGTAGNSDPSGTVGSVNMTADSYVNGSFTRTLRGSFSAISFSSAAIRSIWHSGTPGSAGGCGYRLLLDSAESKTASQALNDLILRKSWGRVLVN